VHDALGWDLIGSVGEPAMHIMGFIVHTVGVGHCCMGRECAIGGIFEHPCCECGWFVHAIESFRFCAGLSVYTGFVLLADAECAMGLVMGYAILLSSCGGG